MGAPKADRKTTRRFYANRCQQGMDGIQAKFALAVKGADTLTIAEEPLMNGTGKRIGAIRCTRGKVDVEVNPVYCVRDNNIMPFCMADASDDNKIETARSMILESIREFLRKHLETPDFARDFNLEKIEVMQAECNLTLKVEKADPSDIITCFEKALNETRLHRERKSKRAFEKKALSCGHSVANKYFVKIYNKSEEQHKKGNPLAENNLLRIEFKFYHSQLKKIYKDTSLNSVLAPNGIMILCREYKRAFEEIEDKEIKPFLSYCKRTLFESLITSSSENKIAETIAKHKDLIVDVEVFRQALKKWYEYNHLEDRSHKVIHYYMKKGFRFPTGVLETIKMFHDCAG